MTTTNIPSAEMPVSQAVELPPLPDDQLVELGRHPVSHGAPWGIGTTREDYLRAVRAAIVQDRAARAQAEQQGISLAWNDDPKNFADQTPRAQAEPAGYRHWWRMSPGTRVAVVSGLDEPDSVDPWGGSSGVFERTEPLYPPAARAQGAGEAVCEALWQTIKRAVECMDNMKYASSGDGAHEDSFDFMQRSYRKELLAALAPTIPQAAEVPGQWRCFDGKVCQSHSDCEEFDFCGRQPAAPTPTASAPKAHNILPPTQEPNHD